MGEHGSLQDLELKYQRDHAAQMRGPALRDALKKCVTGEPSKPYEDLESAVTRLRMINAVVAEALKGL